MSKLTRLMRYCNVFPKTGGQRCWPGASPLARWSSTALISFCKARTRPRFSTFDGASQMTSFLSLHDAVAEYVQDGITVAMEGFTHLIPFAAGHEIIRQRKLVFSWGGNPGVGMLHRLRDAVENGWPQPLELEEHSHAAMANAYAAGAAGLPCAIFRGYQGSDLVGVNPRIRFIECPFSGERLAAVPAIRPDLTIIHAQRADRAGNVL